MPDNLRLFVPITKVDAKQRMVYGLATAEIPDKAGEIMDFESSVPYFKAWSDEIAKATDGKSLGNVRAMHGSVSAGILKSIDYDEANKSIPVAAHINDDNEWAKVEAGNYTGFSIGGGYVARWADGDLKRYTAKPAEISIVDNPMLKEAHFQMVKADGTVEDRQFVGREVKQVWACGLVPGHEHLTKAEAVHCDGGGMDKAERTDSPSPKEGESKYGDVKFADEENKKYPIDTEAHIRAAWNYINKEKNAAKYKDGGKSVKAKIVAAWKAKIDKDGPPSAEAAKKAADGELRKCLYGISDVASAISSLQWVHETEEMEAAREGDASAIPDKLSGLISEAYAVLAEMVAEEANEWAEEEGGEMGAAMNMDATEAEMPMSMAVSAVLKKIETGSDALRQRLEKRAAAKEADEMKPEDLQKMFTDSGEALAKRFEAAVAPMTEKLAKFDERLGNLEKAIPAPGSKVVTRVVGKEQDNADEATTKAAPVIDLTKREHNEADAFTLTKLAHGSPKVF